MVLGVLPSFVNDGTALLGLLIAAITAAVLLRKNIYKPITSAIRSQIREVIQETVGPDIQAIRYEVTLNGGGSLKDELVLVRQQVDSMEQVLLMQRNPLLRHRSTDRV